LVKEQVKRLLNIEISRAEGYAVIKSLKIKFTENGFNPLSEDNWVEVNLNNYEQIIDEAFSEKGMFQFYEEVSEENVSMTKGEINRLYKEKLEERNENERETKKSKKSKTE
jgi:hypothetical protein